MKSLWQGEAVPGIPTAEIMCALVQRPYGFFHLPGHWTAVPLSFLGAQWNALSCGLGSPRPSSGSDLDMTFVLQASSPPSLHTHTPAAEHSVTVAQSRFMSSPSVPETAIWPCIGTELFGSVFFSPESWKIGDISSGGIFLETLEMQEILQSLSWDARDCGDRSQEIFWKWSSWAFTVGLFQDISWTPHDLLRVNFPHVSGGPKWLLLTAAWTLNDPWFRDLGILK